MIRSFQVGDVTVRSVVEYSGPTHDPAFLFPGLSVSELERHRSWLAPHHWVPTINKLVITVQIWVVHAGKNVILIDTGVGNGKRRPAERQNLLNSLLIPWLSAAGAPPESVTHVVHTHLHADHVGWNTTMSADGWVPTFPNATYYFPHEDAEALRTAYSGGDLSVNGGSYVDSVLPVMEAGLAEIVTHGSEIGGCLTAERAPGHTPGQLIFHLQSAGEHGIFAADIMHSPLQIARPDLNSRYCTLPDDARRTRMRLLETASELNALVMPMHFGEPRCGYVRRGKEGFRFQPACCDGTAIADANGEES